MTQQTRMVVTYDTMDEDDAKLGMGLGCNGIIQVLIEPIDPSDHNNPFQILRSVVSGRQKAVVVTLFSLQNKKDIQPGTCLLVKQDGKIIDTTPVLKDVLMTDAMKALDSQTSSFKNYISES